MGIYFYWKSKGVREDKRRFPDQSLGGVIGSIRAVKNPNRYSYKFHHENFEDLKTHGLGYFELLDAEAYVSMLERRQRLDNVSDSLPLSEYDLVRIHRVGRDVEEEFFPSNNNAPIAWTILDMVHTTGKVMVELPGQDRQEVVSQVYLDQEVDYILKEIEE